MSIAVKISAAVVMPLLGATLTAQADGLRPARFSVYSPTTPRIAVEGLS